MNAEFVVKRLLEADRHSETERQVLDQGFAGVQAQQKQSGEMLRQVGAALQKKHPTATHLHQQHSDLMKKRAEADALLAKAKYAAAYRRALAKAGLRPTDVVARFTGRARQERLSNLRLRPGLLMTSVETADGRRVPLDPPVEIPQ